MGVFSVYPNHLIPAGISLNSSYDSVLPSKSSDTHLVVNVTSGAHKNGSIHFNDINLKKNYTVWRAYAQSKLAIILFTYELADKLRDLSEKLTGFKK